MNKDSMDMTDDDHTFIADTALRFSDELDGVVVVHGTDRLANTGERILSRDMGPQSPIVLTGAMRPYELRSTDALQNLTEAFLAVQVVGAGVYVSMHNQLLQFPGVHKDLDLGTFVKND
jgi:L-asparaginase